ncbi:MAG: hypothetical protein J0665_06230 [Deltaproteobacteria bacterium]|nr:hypothetical protein [Deltaproteobacteria bacterium]
MNRKATLVINRKENLADGSIIQTVIWLLPIQLTGSLHRYKYRLYYGKNGVCLVRYDNEQGKGDHRHYAGAEEPYVFVDIPTILHDFRQSIKNLGVDI